MQSKSATKKKTSKAADKNPAAAAAEMKAAPAPANAPSQSSKPKSDTKKTEAVTVKSSKIEAPQNAGANKSSGKALTSAKRHRAVKPAVSAQTDAVSEPLVMEPVVVESPHVAESSVSEVTLASASDSTSAAGAVPETLSFSEEEVRKLAYLFWIERGQPNGSHHEDWFRAEQALATRAFAEPADNRPGSF